MKSILATLSLFLLSSVLFAQDNITALEPEETLSESVESNTWRYYRIELDEPADLTVKLRKVKGNADVYVVSSRKPTQAFHECAPKKKGNRGETCRMKSETSNVWYVGVFGQESSTYDLKVESAGFTGQPTSQYEVGAR